MPNAVAGLRERITLLSCSTFLRAHDAFLCLARGLRAATNIRKLRPIRAISRTKKIRPRAGWGRMIVER
jgi:hypothetical protein